MWTLQRLADSIPPRGNEIRELFPTVKALLAAAREFFDRSNQEPQRILSVIGSHAQRVI